jgi:hypothetical protein
MYLVSGCSEYGLSMRPPLALATTFVVGKALAVFAAPEASGFGFGVGTDAAG